MGIEAEGLVWFGLLWIMERPRGRVPSKTQQDSARPLRVCGKWEAGEGRRLAHSGADDLMVTDSDTPG